MYKNEVIETLGLPNRAINALLNANISTVGDLVSHKRSQVKNMRGIGTDCLNIIEERLHERGMYLGGVVYKSDRERLDAFTMNVLQYASEQYKQIFKS